MTKERLAKNPVRLFGEESSLKIFLEVRLLHFFAFLILSENGISLVRKQLRRDLCPRVRDDGIYEESVFHAIEQAVAECRVAAAAAECDVRVEKLPPLPCARVFFAHFARIEILQVVLRRRGETEFVADEILEHSSTVAADASVSFV